MPKNTAPPTVSGSAIEGQTLTAAAGSWTGNSNSYAYQWQRCSSSGCSDIAGAAASGYTAVSGDVGETLRVVVTASNSHGSSSAASAQTEAVAAAPALPVVAAPTNVAASDVTQTAVTVSWTGSAGAAGYNLYENGVKVGTASGSSTWVIFGAGSPLSCGTSYTFGIQALDGLGGSSAIASTAASTLACSSSTGSAPANTALPAISGSAQEGQTLTATTGTWTGSPSSYAYQWQRCTSASSCSGIAGATASSYVLASADVGDTLRVVVTASNGYGSGSATSAQTAPVADASAPSGTGNVYVSPGGNDSTCARGDSSRPCVTFGRAYALAQPGDTILVAGGDYPAQTVLKGSQSQSGPTISFRCAAGATCRVNGTLALGENNGSLSGDTPSYLSFDGIDVHGVLRTYYNQNTDPQPTHISFLNAHVWNLTNSGHLLEFVDDDSVLVQNVDIGPGCCNGDGLDFTIARPGAPSPSNVTVDGVTIHDYFDSCSHVPSSITSQYGACSGTGYGDDPSGGYDHVDGSQWFGGRNVVWKNSRIYDINAGYPVGQGLFMQPANGGSFANITVENSMFGSTPNNDVSFSGPGTGAFSGYLRLLYNTVQGNLRLYGDTGDEVFEAGTAIDVVGNIVATIGSSNGNGCSIYETGGTLYTPNYSHNLFANQTCGSSDIHGSATFVNASPTGPDLDLAPGSLGIDQADPADYPSTDIHGTARPLGNAPDIGADEAG